MTALIWFHTVLVGDITVCKVNIKGAYNAFILCTLQNPAGTKDISLPVGIRRCD